MAIERHSGFQAEGISGAQAAREDDAFAFCQEQIPDDAHFVRRAEDFVAEFAGVAGAGHQALYATDEDVFGFRIIFGRQLAAFHQRLQDFLALGSLQRDEAGFFGNIGKDCVFQEMGLHVRHILVMGSSIHHHHVTVFAQMVHDEIVDNAAIFIEHGAVTHAADGEVREIVGQEMVQALQRAFPFENDFAHVGHVENPGFGADSHMFRQDALVILHRHQIAAERYHLSLERHMLVIEWCFFIHFLLLYHRTPSLFQSKKAHCKYTVRLCPFDLKDKLIACFFGVHSRTLQRMVFIPVLLPESFAPSAAFYDTLPIPSSLA